MNGTNDGITRRNMVLQLAPAAALAAAGIMPAMAADRSRSDPGPTNPPLDGQNPDSAFDPGPGAGRHGIHAGLRRWKFLGVRDGFAERRDGAPAARSSVEELRRHRSSVEEPPQAGVVHFPDRSSRLTGGRPESSR